MKLIMTEVNTATGEKIGDRQLICLGKAARKLARKLSRESHKAARRAGR